MKFTLTIDCDNAAFEPDIDSGCEPEIARVMRHVAEQLERGATGAPIFDFNGNRVGFFRFVP